MRIPKSVALTMIDRARAAAPNARVALVLGDLAARVEAGTVVLSIRDIDSLGRAVGGREIVLQADTLPQLQDKDVAVLLAHEAAHIALGHRDASMSGVGVERGLWNDAVDYAVNSALGVDRIDLPGAALA